MASPIVDMASPATFIALWPHAHAPRKIVATAAAVAAFLCFMRIITRTHRDASLSRKRSDSPLIGTSVTAYSMRTAHRIEVGDKVSLRIDRMDAGVGVGVGEVDGRHVHVAHAFVGEEIDARVMHVGKRRITATLIDVFEAHPARRDAPCLASKQAGAKCTGCPWLTLSEGAQGDLKQQALSAALGRDVDAWHVGEPWSYRHAATRVAFTLRGDLALGSYITRSHQVADMQGCLVEHPALSRAHEGIVKAAWQLRVGAFDRDDLGLRYVVLKTNGTQTVALFVAGHEDAAGVRALASEEIEGIDAAAFGVNDSDGNAIMPDEVVHVRGSYPVYRVLGHDFTIDPSGFLQPNPELMSSAYEALLCDVNGLLSGAVALELYAGQGAITRALSKGFETVEACDASVHADNRSFVQAQGVDEFLSQQDPTRQIDLLVANPPRSGMSVAVTNAVIALNPERVHLMSCGPKGLRRNLDALCKAGYAIERLEAWDALPQTPHVEVIVRLKRVGA